MDYSQTFIVSCGLDTGIQTGKGLFQISSGSAKIALAFLNFALWD